MNKADLSRDLRSSTSNNPDVFLMQVLEDLIEILAHDLADCYDWVCSMTSPTTKDDFSESVKTAVEQSFRKIHSMSKILHIFCKIVIKTFLESNGCFMN